MDDDDHDLSERQLLLLEGLRAAEREGRVVDLRVLAQRTGYSESTIRTYFTKRLEGAFVFRDETGAFSVRGAVRCTPEDFARRMSQKLGAANDVLRTEDAWRTVVRKLLYEGQRRRYTLSREELELVEELGPAPRPRTDEVAIQPTLFGPGKGSREPDR